MPESATFNKKFFLLTNSGYARGMKRERSGLVCSSGSGAPPGVGLGERRRGQVSVLVTLGRGSILLVGRAELR